MPRPRKWRNVCELPASTQFGPLNPSAEIKQSIRLIDLEGFTQEECANQMNIARTTVQGIYSEARKKVADSLVNGKVLLIEGGDYQLCDGMGMPCSGGGCFRFRHGRGNRR